PIVCSLTFQKNGRTLMGNDALSAVTVLEGLGVEALGVNCSLGPEELLPVVGEFVKAAHVPVLVQANAGLPELSGGKPLYPLHPESFADSAEKMADMGVKLMGGCCGTNPDFIRMLCERLHNKKWNKPDNPMLTAAASSRQTVLFDKGIRIVGQRINPVSCPNMMQGLQDGDLNFLYEEALLQKQAGADILDINVCTGQSNEAEIMVKTVEFIQSMVPIALQLDSEDYQVMEAGARIVNGKPILNSVNGSEQSKKRILPLARKYGACVIGMTLDEKGIPDSAEGRLRIAESILDTALSYGIRKEDLIIDCIAESASQQPGAAGITLQSISLIKQELGLKTILGISNISHGMKNRPALNAAFLAMALGAGLDCAILDPCSQMIAGTIEAYRLITGEAE
ncbi:MAG: homocysteine S-methyltransferase family protein, partial [Caldicoprobacterales bacterium]